MPGTGKVVGRQQPTPAEWRCNICKFTNPTFVDSDGLKKLKVKQTVDHCQKCHETKQVFKIESKIAKDIR